MPGRAPSDSGTSALEVARQLSFPRQSGTPGNLRAVELVAGWFEEAGLEVCQEWFSYDIRPAFRALRVMLLVAAILLGVASVLVIRAPVMAVIVLAVALGGSGVFLAWAPWLEKLYRGEGGTKAANVEGRLRVADPRMTLILVAHHDSKSQNLTLPFRALFTLLAIGSGVTLSVLAVIGALLGPTAVPVGWAVVAGLAGVISLLFLSTLRNGNASPGGVDNAGSVGLLVELAYRLAGELPDDTELIVLSPGAEEDHMVGAMRWLDRHRQDFVGRPVWAVNIDGAGIPGRVTLLERYGLGKKFSPRLSAVARAAAAKLDLRVRGILIPPAMGVDAIPFVHRGVPCLTLTSGSLGRASLSVHSRNDRFEHLDEQALHRVRDLIVGMVEELVAEREQKKAGAEAPARRTEEDSA